MTREWFLNGARTLEPPRLSSERKEQIERVLEERSLASGDLTGFFSAIADAIAHFDTQVEWRRSSLPAKVRENLSRARAAAMKLLDALNKLDDNSCQLLSEVAEGGVPQHYENLWPIISALTKAERKAQEYPNTKPPENHRVFLAADVADAIETYLGKRPTKTREGLFAEILELVLEEATGEEVKAVHGLVQKALSHEVKCKHPIEDAPGEWFPEYIPPSEAK